MGCHIVDHDKLHFRFNIHFIVTSRTESLLSSSTLPLSSSHSSLLSSSSSDIPRLNDYLADAETDVVYDVSWHWIIGSILARRVLPMESFLVKPDKKSGTIADVESISVKMNWTKYFHDYFKV